MRRHRVTVALPGAAAVWCAAPVAVPAEPAAWAAALAGSGGTAIDVPGLVSMNQGEQAEVRSVLRGAADNCTAGGFYRDAASQAHAFVVRETSGVWRKAIEVPGLGVLNARGDAGVDTVVIGTRQRDCLCGPGLADSGGHREGGRGARPACHAAMLPPGTRGPA